MNAKSTSICPFCQPVLLHSTTNHVECKVYGAATSRILASLLLAVLLPVYAYAQQERLDAATELRSQDGAFSLLIESYRQIQGELIESDYKARLQAAVQLSDLEKRREVIALAARERDLRFAKLAKVLVNFSGAYELIRRGDERKAGIIVPNSVNTDVAAAKLRNFVPLALLVPSQQEIDGMRRVTHTYNRFPTTPVLGSASEKVGWHMTHEAERSLIADVDEDGEGRIVPMIAQNSLDHPFAGQNDVPGGDNPVWEGLKLTCGHSQRE